MDQLLESLATWLTVFVIHVAAVRSHLSVSSNVHLQVAQLAEPLVALVALVLHLPFGLLFTSNCHFLLFDCRLSLCAAALLLPRKGLFSVFVDPASQNCLSYNQLAVGLSLHLNTRRDMWDNGREG